MGNAQAVLARKRQVLIDVALRVDDRRAARLLVADDVRRVRETVQIELLEDHAGIIMPPGKSNR